MDSFPPKIRTFLGTFFRLMLFSLVLFSCARETPAPPAAKIIPQADTLFGDIRVDNYYWLRERNNPAVIEYLQAENAYTFAMLKPTEALQETLYQEMKGRIRESDDSVPVKNGDYYYYSRTEAGEQYPLYCRKKGSLAAPEEIYLDQNKLAEGRAFYEIGIREISPHQRLLAYSVDTTGLEVYTIYFKDLFSGQALGETIPNTYYGAAWANDNKTLFYITLDAAKRPYKLFRHTLGSDPQADAEVYHEQDEAYHLNLFKTKSQAYLILELASLVTSEAWYLDANRAESAFKLIQPRRHEIEYYVEHHGDQFIIRTNDDAPNFKLVSAPVTNPAKSRWKEVLAHRDSVKIENIEVFRDRLVVFERKKGLEQIRVSDFSGKSFHYVEMPEQVYTLSPGENPEYGADSLRFVYSSLTAPKSYFAYHPTARRLVLNKREEVPGGYDPTQYQSERIFAPAGDGALIPVSLVYKKGMPKDGGHPLMLYGYGAYGNSSEPYFSVARLSLLERGFVYAIAHVRGGGEMGRYWYEQGRLLNKKNTFTDFIACAEHLIAQKYTSPDKLVISGGSAGGLLMGAVATMRPDLFKTVVAHVPFVDVLNTMLDSAIPLTVIEYEEWGNPHIEEYYFYLKSYAPYENVAAKAYPNMLITAGLNDARVPYWEPAKWIAKLRALKTDSNRLLLNVNMGAGHGGASGRYDELREVALEYAFVLDCLGIKE